MTRLIVEGKLKRVVLLAGAMLALGAPLYAAGEQTVAEDLSTDEEIAAPGLPVGLPAHGQRLAAGAEKNVSTKAIDGRARLNAAGMGAWQASFDAKSGNVKILYGAQSRKFAQGGEAAARAFLAEGHTVFGLKQDLAELKTLRTDVTAERDHTRFQQVYNGVPVVGAQVIVHTDKNNQVTMVQSGLISDLQPGNSIVIAEEAAVGIALDDLKGTKGSGILLSQPKSEKQLSLHNGKRLYVWRVSIPSRNPFGLWVYEIDAESGAILYKKNEILSLKAGKGNVFKTNADYYLGKVSSAPLKNLLTAAETEFWGYLNGRYAYVLSDNNNNPWSDSYKFLYNPITEPDYFHATQAYYSINTVRDWWLKTIVSKYAAGQVDGNNPFTWNIPIIANVADMCNAFYSPNLGEDFNNSPGMVFGNEASCANSSADLVLDWDVVRHEYTHAMADWFGFGSQFGGPVDYYGRAMGEGNADWYAYLLHPKDSRMATVAWGWSSNGYLRNLSNTRMYPRDVDCVPCNELLPEEHYTGEIWGGYLYDLYRILGSKAVQYIVQSYFYFNPSGGMMDDQPDFYDAIRAGVIAEGDLTGKLASSAKIWGLWASRGISGGLEPQYSHPTNYFFTGQPGSDSRPAIWWQFPSTKAIATKGNLLKSNDRHDFIFESKNPNMTVIASVAGAKGGMINPVMNLFDENGTPVAATFSVKGSKGTLTTKLANAGVYVIRVSGQTSTPAQGYYDFKIAVK